MTLEQFRLQFVQLVEQLCSSQPEKPEQLSEHQEAFDHLNLMLDLLNQFLRIRRRQSL